MGIFSTFTSSITAILWGLLLAIIVTVAVFFLVRAWYSTSRRFSVISYLVGLILFIFLTFQFTGLVCAVKLKGVLSEISATINTNINNIDSTTNISREDINNILVKTIRSIPLASSIVSPEDVRSCNSKNLGEAVTNKINTDCNWFIVRRIVWTLLFVILALFGIGKTMGGETVSSKRPPTTNRLTEDF